MQDVHSRISVAIDRYNKARSKLKPSWHALPLKAVEDPDLAPAMDEFLKAHAALKAECTESGAEIASEYSEIVADLGRDFERWIEVRSVYVSRHRKVRKGGPQTNLRPIRVGVGGCFSCGSPEQIALAESQKLLTDDRPLEVPRPIGSFTPQDFIDAVKEQRTRLTKAVDSYVASRHWPKNIAKEKRMELERVQVKRENELRVIQELIATDALRRRLAGALPKVLPAHARTMERAAELIAEIGREVFTLAARFPEFRAKDHQLGDIIGQLEVIRDGKVSPPIDVKAIAPMPAGPAGEQVQGKSNGGAQPKRDSTLKDLSRKAVEFAESDEQKMKQRVKLMTQWLSTRYRGKYPGDRQFARDLTAEGPIPVNQPSVKYAIEKLPKTHDLNVARLIYLGERRNSSSVPTTEYNHNASAAKQAGDYTRQNAKSNEPAVDDPSDEEIWNRERLASEAVRDDKPEHA